MANHLPPGVPAAEDFIGKYAEANAIHGRLLDGYFAAVRDFIRLIPPTELRIALEVGCGAGYSTERLRGILAPEVQLEASEFLDWQVKVAQQRLPTVSVVQEDVYHLRRADKSLDLIFLLEVLEHLENYQAALQELRRVAKYIIVGVPHEPWWRILNMARGKYIGSFGNTPGHLNHWSRRGLVNLVKQSGFSVLGVRSPLPWTIVLGQRR